MEHEKTAPSLRDGATTYGLVSRINHWIIAAAMLGMLGSGLVMAYGPFEHEAVFAVMGWHKAIGVLVLGYGVWRVGWRVVQGFPAEASVMPRWQANASKMTHWALLGTVLAMPLSGIVMSIYSGREINAFGLLIPARGKVDWVADAAGVIHHYAAWALVVLLILHIGAALKHHAIDRDPTLRRMIAGSA